MPCLGIEVMAFAATLCCATTVHKVLLSLPVIVAGLPSVSGFVSLGRSSSLRCLHACLRQFPESVQVKEQLNDQLLDRGVIIEQVLLREIAVPVSLQPSQPPCIAAHAEMQPMRLTGSALSLFVSQICRHTRLYRCVH